MNTQTRFSILISALTAAAGLSTIASAQAPAPAPTACPAAYFSLDMIWYNNATKTVVSAGAASLGIAVADERIGWTLGSLCQHNETGDVQIFDRKTAVVPDSSVN